MPRALTISAWIAVASIAVQAVLACFMLSGVHGLGHIHEGFGYITLLASIVAAVLAVVWRRRGGPSSVVGHASGTAVLLIVQFILGEVGHPVKWIHVVLGVVMVIAVVGLPQTISKAARRPAAAK